MRHGLGAWTTLLAVVATVGCDSADPCPDGTEDVDGACVPLDTDEPHTDTDADTGEPLPGEDLSLVTVEWSITRVPNDNVVMLVCDERRLMREHRFTVYSEYSKAFEVTGGARCNVVLEDSRGGLLPPGRLLVCGQEVQSWEAERGTSRELDPIDASRCVEGCTDPVANNHDPRANLDDQSCTYTYGCTHELAPNYDPEATRNDGTCAFDGEGLVELQVFNEANPSRNVVRVYCNEGEAIKLATSVPWASESRQLHVHAGLECSVTVADVAGDQGPGGLVRMCGETVVAWDPPAGLNRPYEVEVGTFTVLSCSGCTDPISPDYDPAALVSDGSCTFPLPVP